MKDLSRLMVLYGSVHDWWAPVLGQNPVVMVSLYLTAVQSERARGRGTRSCPRDLFPPAGSHLLKFLALLKILPLWETQHTRHFLLIPLTTSVGDTQEL